MNYLSSKVTLVLIFGSFFIMNAQQILNERLPEARLNDLQTLNDLKKNTSKFKDNSDLYIDGSPYINKNFANARITKYKDTLYNIRYNGFNNEMEILSDDSKIITLDSNNDYEITFTLTNKVYRTVTYNNDYDIPIKRFLIVLSEKEKCSLFKKEHIKFFEKTEAKNSYSKEKPAKYKRVDDIYFIKINDIITSLPQKKKHFLELFPNEEKELKKYMKENKLGLKNENELIKIVEYLSTIIE